MARIAIAVVLVIAGVLLVTGVFLMMSANDDGLGDWSEPLTHDRADAASPAAAAPSPSRPTPAPPRSRPAPEPEPEAKRPEPASPEEAILVEGPRPKPRPRRLEPPRGPGEVSGTVVDQAGRVVIHAGVWLLTGDADRASTRSDERGRFAFRGLPLGRHRVEVEPALDDKFGGFAITSVTVRLQAGSPVARPRIVVNRGLFVRGVVIGPDRRPVADVPVIVFGSRDDLFGEMGIAATSDKGGQFAIGPLRPGSLMVQADGSDGLADSRPARVTAGMSGVTLRLPRAASLYGAATCPTRKVRASCEVRAYLRSRWVWERVWADKTHGEFAFDELEPDVYDLVAVDAAGNVGVRHGVDVGEGARLTRVNLTLAPGGRIALILEGKDLAARLAESPHKWDVRQHGAIVYSTRASSNHQRATVPPGPCRVRLVRLHDEVVIAERAVSALPGRRVKIVVPLP